MTRDALVLGVVAVGLLAAAAPTGAAWMPELTRKAANAGHDNYESSDLVSHHVRDNVLAGANVTAAQGSYEGPPVLQRLSAFATSYDTANFPALTGIPLAVGVITLGNDGEGGCGVIPFHNHPNCYEVMTTLSGKGAYGQIRPDGTTQWSRILETGDTWVMQQGSQHYYRNIDPEGTWVFEIAFTCSEVGSTSMWKWIGYVDEQLAQNFFPGLDAASAADLTVTPDARLQKDSPRYIRECASDYQKHASTNTDRDLFSSFSSGAPDLQQVTPAGRWIFGGNAPFAAHATWANAKHPRAGLSLGLLELKPQGMMQPVVCSTSHILYHVLEGEVMVAQWSWDNKMVIDVLQRHDLLLVPTGSVHFIINPLAGPGALEGTDYPAARLMGHFDDNQDNDGTQRKQPSLSVASNFFSEQDSRLLEAVLKTSPEASRQVAAAAKQGMFGLFSGDIGALKRWVGNRNQYRPLSEGSGGSPGSPSQSGAGGLELVQIDGHNSGNSVPGWLVLLCCLSLLCNLVVGWGLLVVSKALKLNFLGDRTAHLVVESSDSTMRSAGMPNWSEMSAEAVASNGGGRVIT